MKRWWEVGAIVVAASGVAACTGSREHNAATVRNGTDCHAQIVVGFATAADAESIGALAEASATQLAIVDRLLANLYVLDLVAGDADCALALARLRADRRVRSVEIDVRRSAHE